MVKKKKVFKIIAIFHQKRQEGAPKALQADLAQLSPQEKSQEHVLCKFL